MLTAITEQMVDREALFKDNIDWAKSIARSVHDKLPPSFALDDLEQEALIEHAKRVKMYDPDKNSSYQGFAFRAVRGAALMVCRWKHYRNATMAPLESTDAVKAIRERATGVDAETRRREWREQRRLRLLRLKLNRLPEPEAVMVQAVLIEGERITAVAHRTGMDVSEVTRLLRAAAKRLRKPDRPDRGATALLRLLEEAGGDTQARIAAKLGCTQQAVSQRLQRLKARGLIGMRGLRKVGMA